MSPAHLSLVLLTACEPVKIAQTPGETGAPGDTSETGDTAAPILPPDPPTDLSIRLSDTIASIAYVSWTQPSDGESWVEWQLDGEDPQITPTVARAAGTTEQILLGIPYATAFHWRVVVERGGVQVASELQTFSTGDPPEDMPIPELLLSEPELYDTEAPYVLGSVNACGWDGRCAQFWSFIVDRQGRLVWALATPDNHWTLYAQPSQDGRAILWDEATYWSDFDGGADSQVHRMTLDGTIEESYPTPGLHHSFQQLPDGTLVWGQADDPDENLVERAPDGTQRTIWSCRELLHKLEVREECQSNSLWYNADNDSFLFSFYTFNSIVEIDHSSGDTLRYWGELGGTFSPAEDQFSWQHGPSWTEDGHLLVSSLRDIDHEEETVAYEYAIDGDTLTEVWDAGVGEGVHGGTNGEAHRLANGNTLHNLGEAGRLREWTPDKQLVWDLDFGRGRLLGHTLFVGDLYALAP